MNMVQKSLDFIVANCTSSHAASILPAADLGIAFMKATFPTFLYGATCSPPAPPCTCPQ